MYCINTPALECLWHTENMTRTKTASPHPLMSVLPSMLMSGLVLFAVTAQAKQKETLKEFVLLPVPFFAQAPLGEWSDLRQKYGCEETAALMAMLWARGQTATVDEAVTHITTASDEEMLQYGSYEDTSAADTVTRILEQHFEYYDATVSYDVTAEDIERALSDGNLVLAPVDGRMLGNPWYVPPGPPRHMVVVKGYERASGMFILADPGTSRGSLFVISTDAFMNALADYPSGHGDNAGAVALRTAIITITPEKTTAS